MFIYVHYRRVTLRPSKNRRITTLELEIHYVFRQGRSELRETVGSCSVPSVRLPVVKLRHFPRGTSDSPIKSRSFPVHDPIADQPIGLCQEQRRSVPIQAAPDFRRSPVDTASP